MTKSLIAVAVLLTAPLAWGDEQSVDKRAPADPQGEVEVSNVAGNVSISGWDRNEVEVIGTLPTYTTVTNFVVTPVVALIEPGFTVAPDPFEVAEVFEVPLEFLMTPAHHRRHSFEWPGGRREFLSMPWRAAPDAADVFIWGATAAMLRNFYAFLSA